jgi:hypothetical protein
MITYFNSKTPFAPTKFLPINNGDSFYLNKPIGGLWTSPNHDWLDWCSLEQPDWITNYFELDIDEQNLLQIFDEDTLRTLPTIFEKGTYRSSIMIDYEALIKQSYSGIWVKAREMRWCQQPNFYAWDCETILIFDTSIIQSIKQIPIPEEYLQRIEVESQ